MVLLLQLPVDISSCREGCIWQQQQSKRSAAQRAKEGRSRSGWRPVGEEKGA